MSHPAHRIIVLLGILGVLVIAGVSPVIPTFAKAESSTVHIVTSISACCGTSLIYNPIARLIFAINSTNIYIINSTTNKIISNILFETPITASAYDPSNYDLYVSYCSTPKCQTYDISVINSTQVLTTITARGNSSAPYATGYDPANKELYFAGDNSCPYCTRRQYMYAIALNTTTNTIAATFILAEQSNSGDNGFYVSDIIYDPASFDMFVSSCYWNNFPSMGCSVSVIDAANAVVKTIDSGSSLSLNSNQMVYDPANNIMFVNSNCNGNGNCFASALINSSNAIVARLPKGKGWPSYYVTPDTFSSYDPSNKEMYISCNYVPCYGNQNGPCAQQFDCENVVAVNTANQIVFRLNASSFGEFYNPANQDLYLSTGIAGSFTGNNITVFNNHNKVAAVLPIESTDYYSGTACCLSTFNPSSMDIYVSNGTMLFVVKPTNVISNSLTIGCNSMLYDPENSDIYCSGNQRIFVIS